MCVYLYTENYSKKKKTSFLQQKIRRNTVQLSTNKSLWTFNRKPDGPQTSVTETY